MAKNDLIRGFMKRKFDVSDVLKEAWGLTVDYFFCMDSRACYHSTAVFYSGAVNSIFFSIDFYISSKYNSAGISMFFCDCLYP